MTKNILQTLVSIKHLNRSRNPKTESCHNTDPAVTGRTGRLSLGTRGVSSADNAGVVQYLAPWKNDPRLKYDIVFWPGGQYTTQVFWPPL